MLQAVKQAFLDCMSNSTMHGLPQIAKPRNIFLLLLWIVFFFVAFGGCIFMIFQSVEEFLQYGVITATNIKRESEITMPAITFCSYENPRDMIVSCRFENSECKITNLTIYNKFGIQENCVQLNYGTNVTELVKSTREDWVFGYMLYVYMPPKSFLHFDITENNAKVVDDDIHNEIFGGKSTKITLTKTVQTVLGQPHSDCNEASGYRQANCEEDCFYKHMSTTCGCAYPTECGSYFENDEKKKKWTQECKEAFDKKAGSIRSQCSLSCPVECNQVKFGINRQDIEFEFEGDLIFSSTFIYNAYQVNNNKNKLEQSFDNAKREVSKNFDVTGLTNDQFKKRFTEIYFYFSKLETTRITQSPSMTLTNLIANVGGLLGKSLYLIEMLENFE